MIKDIALHMVFCAAAVPTPMDMLLRWRCPRASSACLDGRHWMCMRTLAEALARLLLCGMAAVADWSRWLKAAPFASLARLCLVVCASALVRIDEWGVLVPGRKITRMDPKQVSALQAAGGSDE